MNLSTFGLTSTHFAATTESRLLLAHRAGSPEARAELYCWTFSAAGKCGLKFLKWRKPDERIWGGRIYPKLESIVEKTVDSFLKGQPTSTRITTQVYKPVEWFIKQEKQTLFGERTSHQGKREKLAREQFADLADKLGRTPTLDEFEDRFRKFQRRHLERTLDRDQRIREQAYLIKKYQPVLLGEES